MHASLASSFHGAVKHNQSPVIGASTPDLIGLLAGKPGVSSGAKSALMLVFVPGRLICSLHAAQETPRSTYARHAAKSAAIVEVRLLAKSFSWRE